MTAFREERLQGLSGMEGNLHVPFLGGWAGAIPSGYPAGESNLASLSRPYMEGIRDEHRIDTPSKVLKLRKRGCTGQWRLQLALRQRHRIEARIRRKDTSSEACRFE